MNTKENRKMPSFVGPLAAVVVLSVVLTVVSRQFLTLDNWKIGRASCRERVFRAV